jgi:hypothetical protein
MTNDIRDMTDDMNAFGSSSVGTNRPDKIAGTRVVPRFMIEITTETRHIIAGMTQVLRGLDEIPGKQIPVLVKIASRMYCSFEAGA